MTKKKPVSKKVGRKQTAGGGAAARPPKATKQAGPDERGARPAPDVDELIQGVLALIEQYLLPASRRAFSIPAPPRPGPSPSHSPSPRPGHPTVSGGGLQPAPTMPDTDGFWRGLEDLRRRQHPI